MKTPFLLLALLCLFSNQIQAQAWQQQNPNFSSSTFIQEVVAPNSSAAWAYGFVYDSTGNFTYRSYSVSRTTTVGKAGKTWLSRILSRIFFQPLRPERRGCLDRLRRLRQRTEDPENYRRRAKLGGAAPRHDGLDQFYATSSTMPLDFSMATLMTGVRAIYQQQWRYFLGTGSPSRCATGPTRRVWMGELL
ncbi:MAG: hypothetical protein H6559_29800 [Lewinellaceae bacterium]|nr:hypothetical protein [Lewinellaceae bacterium]